jgi:circadian clock protein KaiB
VHLTEPRYELTLFVSGASGSSARAVRNAQALCEAHLDGHHDLTIVDVNHDPELAVRHRVLATPTLLKSQPAPECMIVGDLSDRERVLRALDLPVADQADATAGA